MAESLPSLPVPDLPPPSAAATELLPALRAAVPAVLRPTPVVAAERAVRLGSLLARRQIDLAGAMAGVGIEMAGRMGPLWLLALEGAGRRDAADTTATLLQETMRVWSDAGRPMIDIAEAQGHAAADAIEEIAGWVDEAG